jgi:hypothetical protein
MRADFAGNGDSSAEKKSRAQIHRTRHFCVSGRFPEVIDLTFLHHLQDEFIVFIVRRKGVSRHSLELNAVIVWIRLAVIVFAKPDHHRNAVWKRGASTMSRAMPMNAERAGRTMQRDLIAFI